jgi:hypothetical protein
MMFAALPTKVEVFQRKTAILGFRKTDGEHSLCTACEGFKHELRRAKGVLERQSIIEAYSVHLQGQWKDRMVYWAARSMSCQWVMATLSLDSLSSALSACQSMSLLTVISDGMDQAKFCIPRWGRRRTHLVEKFPRPSCHTQGVLAHGHALHMGLSLPDVPKDSWSSVETLARMFDAILAQHNTLPHHLHLQQDNCARDCKNQKVMKWICFLLIKGVFRTANLSFLRKGHTHEDGNRRSNICVSVCPCV